MYACTFIDQGLNGRLIFLPFKPWSIKHKTKNNLTLLEICLEQLFPGGVPGMESIVGEKET